MKVYLKQKGSQIFLKRNRDPCALTYHVLKVIFKFFYENWKEFIKIKDQRLTKLIRHTRHKCKQT